MQQRFLTDRQVAERYAVNRVTIWRWSAASEGFPKPVKVGLNCTRWRLSDLEKWEAKLDPRRSDQGAASST